jgi:E3 ubiquitin-protein ligase HUWE1
MKGFHELIPKTVISIFNEYELELLIAGLPDIDPADWMQNTVYSQYTESSQIVQWFWQIVQDMTLEDKALLLQFGRFCYRIYSNLNSQWNQ